MRKFNRIYYTIFIPIGSDESGSFFGLKYSKKFLIGNVFQGIGYYYKEKDFKTSLNHKEYSISDSFTDFLKLLDISGFIVK